MLIFGGGGDIGVTEQYLHNPRLDVLLHKSGRVAVPQTVRRRPFDLGPLGNIPERVAERGTAKRTGIVAIGKQPQWIAVYSPHVAQALDDRPWQRDKTFIVALPDHFQKLIGRVDRGHWQGRGFAHPQSARVHQ